MLDSQKGRLFFIHFRWDGLLLLSLPLGRPFHFHCYFPQPFDQDEVARRPVSLIVSLSYQLLL
jgi:hypothetical protein